MSNLDIVKVIDLCDEFKNNAEAMVQSSPELAQKAQEVMTPYMEDFLGLAMDLATMAMGISSQEEADALKNDEDFQGVALKFVDLLAEASAQIFTAEQSEQALPEGLKGNNEAAELLRARDANNMANVCVAAPAP